MALLSATSLYAYAEGPDAGVAHVPGEWSCSMCHLGTFGTGNVAVNFPGGLNYTPGVSQHLIVTITDPVQRRWGFELTARLASSSATQAGSFTISPDGYTQLVCADPAFLSQVHGSTCPASMPMQYIEHTLVGTRLGTKSPVSFQFDWTPPATAGGTLRSTSPAMPRMAIIRCSAIILITSSTR